MSQGPRTTPLVIMQEGDLPQYSILTLSPELTDLVILTYELEKTREERTVHIKLTDTKTADVQVLTQAIKELMWRVESGGGIATQLEEILCQHPQNIAEELWTVLNSQSELAETKDLKATSYVSTDDRTA